MDVAAASAPANAAAAVYFRILFMVAPFFLYVRHAHEWHHGGTAAAIGLGAGALIGAAAANSAYYGDPYYADYDYNGYAYEPAPAYYGDYAYSPGYYPWSRSRSLNHGQGPGCIQSPASYEYTSCD
jgi:hypothetical protein